MKHKKLQIFAVPYIIWVIGFTIIPLLMILTKALFDKTGNFTTENIFAIFDPIHRKALLLSFGLGLITTLVCIVLSFPVALVLRKSKIKKKNIILFILILPMWMNFILRILAIQMLISNNGIINLILTSLGLCKINIINTPVGVVFGMVYDYLPYMLLPVLNSVLAIPENMIEAASDLGANSFQTLIRVIIPLALSGIGSGITMVFVPSMTEFVIANILGGGKILLLGNIIEQEFNTTMNWNLGSGLSVALMAFVLITSIIFGRSSNASAEGAVTL